MTTITTIAIAAAIAATTVAAYLWLCVRVERERSQHLARLYCMEQRRTADLTAQLDKAEAEQVRHVEWVVAE